MSNYRVYILRDASGRVLYVGMTTSLQRRLRQHHTEKMWMADVTSVETTDGLTETEARSKERTPGLPRRRRGAARRRCRRATGSIRAGRRPLLEHAPGRGVGALFA